MRFKNKKDTELFSSLHPILIMIYADLNWYAKEKHGVSLVVTQTVSTLKEDMKYKRKSSSHRENRALDIRTLGLDVFVLKDIINYINEKEEYKKFHYLRRSGSRILAYFHMGTAEHIHLAIHSDYKFNNWDL